MATGPSIVRFTDHAIVKADLLGYARTDVAQAVLDGHQDRTRKPRPGRLAGHPGPARRRLQPPPPRPPDHPFDRDPLAPHLTSDCREDRRPLRPASRHRLVAL